ncbi:unnamed protein product [Toxocara canis]|uniref:BRCT domain-containing protein n=1 Tax=Toxocara canis TaxID=6265 RepID=A0A183UM72_TOXCA|nr:unnamed protein product [Toxocara canis]
MRKEDGVEGTNSMRILDGASPPIQNGHLIDGEIGACAAEPSVSSMVAIIDNGPIDTPPHGDCVNEEISTKIDPYKEVTVVRRADRCLVKAGGVPNGGDRFLAGIGTFLDSSTQLADAGVIDMGAQSNNQQSSSKDVDEIASATSLKPAHIADRFHESAGGNFASTELRTRSDVRSLESHSREVDMDRNEQAQMVLKPEAGVFNQATTSETVVSFETKHSQGPSANTDSARESTACEELMKESVVNPEQVRESATCELTEESLATQDRAHESSASEPVQESPASPDPMREVSWLPPLYVPEIPLSAHEEEQADQHSLDCDPQLMQAVLELSASVDTSSLAINKKPPAQMPVPIEPHSMVRSYDRTSYPRSSHGRKCVLPKRSHQQAQQANTESGAAEVVQHTGKTISEPALPMSDATKVSENDTNKKAASAERHSALGASGSVKAGTSRIMAPLTINTELKRNTADVRRKRGVVSAPLSASSDRTSVTASEWKSRRQSSAELAADERINLPSQQTLNKALDLLRTNEPCLSFDSSAEPSPSSKTIPVKSSPVKKEVVKRKTIQDRLDRIREQNALVLSIPAFQNANTTQLAILLRRFKKYWKVRNYLSEELIQHVLNNEHTDNQTSSKSDLERLYVIFYYFTYELLVPICVMDKEVRAKLRAFREVSDPEATESSSDDDDDMPDAAIPSTSTSAGHVHISRDNPLYRLYRMRVEFGALQLRAEYEEEECARMMEITRQQLSELETKSERFTSDVFEGAEEGSCARCIPVKSTLRRKIMRRNLQRLADMEKRVEVVATSTCPMERIPAYASLDGRLSKDLSSLAGTEEKKIAQESSSQSFPSWDRAPWMSYLHNKKVTCVSEERKKRKRDADRDVSDSPLRKARRNSSASSRRVSLLKHAGSRLVRRSLDYKRNGERMLRRDDAHTPERRHSTTSVNHSVDTPVTTESGLDSSVLGLPQKIDYKEIYIPK